MKVVEAPLELGLLLNLLRYDLVLDFLYAIDGHGSHASVLEVQG